MPLCRRVGSCWCRAVVPADLDDQSGFDLRIVDARRVKSGNTDNALDALSNCETGGEPAVPLIDTG